MFHLSNTSVAFANTIRRSLSTLCPTIAFNEDAKAYYVNAEGNDIIEDQIDMSSL